MVLGTAVAAVVAGRMTTIVTVMTRIVAWMRVMIAILVIVIVILIAMIVSLVHFGEIDLNVIVWISLWNRDFLLLREVLVLVLLPAATSFGASSGAMISSLGRM